MTEPDKVPLAESEGDWYEMQAALGRAISAWGSIEGNLSVVFERAVAGTNRSTAAQAAFSAILSFEAQLAMTDAAMKMTFANKADILDKWKALAKRVDKLRPRRNRLAHGQIVRHIKNHEPVRMLFMPFFHVHQIHREVTDFEWLTLDDLNKLFDAFQNLSSDLWNFHHAISWHELSKREHPKPSPEPDHD